MAIEDTKPLRKYMHTLTRFGEVVRQQREHEGLSVKALAEMAGVTTEYVERAEAGSAEPGLDSAYRVVRALGITPVALPRELGASRQ